MEPVTLRDKHMVRMSDSNPSSPPPLLEAVGLHTYYGACHVLHGVDISVQPGETVCLMGRNGMGKTTLLRSILGLTPPQRGKVRIKGEDVTGAAPHHIAKKGVALVPETRAIFPNLTVRENLVMAARPGNVGRDFRSEDGWDLHKVLELFPRLGERFFHMGNTLSGGEQQMLTIGRALMTNPKLLLLDEATEGLAPLIREEIWNVVRTIKAKGVAALVVDKDVNRLLEISGRALIIEKGVIVHQGPAADLAGRPDIHLRYLGV
jgi:branched-chain amino acid transport system ATP-binding protein